MLYLEKIKKQTNILKKIENADNSEQIDVNSLPNIRIKNMATNQSLCMNFTPDAFNSIVNLSSVLRPE